VQIKPWKGKNGKKKKGGGKNFRKMNRNRPGLRKTPHGLSPTVAVCHVD
jgi:hypothetical protein